MDTVLPTREELEHELELSAQVVGILLGSADDEMYADVLTLVLRTFQSRFGFFGYIDDAGSLVCPSMTRDIFGACDIANKTITFPRSVWGGLWGRVLSERKGLYKNGTHNVPAGHLPLYTSMGAPLLHQSELIGSIHVANKADGYTERDLHLLERIASIIAPVLAARLQRDRQEAGRGAAEAALREHVDRLAQTNAALEAANDEIRRQLQELSTPVIQVWQGVLVAPVVGQLDAERMQHLLGHLLEVVSSSRSSVVLLDITGMPVVDSRAAQLLLQATSAVRLLGAQVVLTGVRPSIAQTMVGLGLDLASFVTRGSLASGLELAFNVLRLRVVDG